MKKIKGLFLTTLAACLSLVPGLALAAGGGGGAPIVIVSDTRKLEGVLKWWGSLYNDSHMEFAILTCILIPVVGCILGLLADVVMGWIGIDLKKRELAEH
jgi:hypothetical protein